MNKFIELVEGVDGPILDVGFGAGCQIEELLLKGKDVYGIEYNENYLLNLKNRISNVELERNFLCGNLFQIIDKKMFKEDHFSLLYSFGVLHYYNFNDCKKAISIFSKLLISQGYLCLKINSKNHGINITVQDSPNGELALDMKGRIKFYDSDEILEMLNPHFSIISMEENNGKFTNVEFEINPKLKKYGIENYSIFEIICIKKT